MHIKLTHLIMTPLWDVISILYKSTLWHKGAKWFCQDKTDDKGQSWDLNTKQPEFKCQDALYSSCSKSSTDDTLIPHCSYLPPLASSHNTTFLYSVFPPHSVHISWIYVLSMVISSYHVCTSQPHHPILYSFTFTPSPQIKIMEEKAS